MKGSITRKFTRVGACGSNVKQANEFISAGDGTTYVYNNTTNADACMFYGLNLETLRNLPNLKITGFKFSFTGGRYNSASSASSSRLSFRIVTDFATSGTGVGTYTSITNNSITVSQGSVSPYTVYEKTQNDMPELLTWMNNNINKLLNGYTSNSFGIRMYFIYAQLKNLDVTIEYEYGGPVTGIKISPENLKLTLGSVKNNLFDFSKWVSAGISANAGIVTTQNNGFALVSTANDSYTNTYHMNQSPNANDTSVVDKYGISITGGKTYTVACEVSQESSNNSEVFVFFYNSSKAYLYFRNAEKVGSGTVYITLTAPSDAKYLCFRFDNNVSSNTNVYSNIRVYEGDDSSLGNSGNILAQVLPYNATNQHYSLSNNRTDVVNLSSDGHLTALKEGVATITATSDDGKYTTTSIITVVSTNIYNIISHVKEIKQIKKGSTEIKKVYLGNKKIFSKTS